MQSLVMGYWGQVAALVRKDFQVAKKSKKGTACEIVLPLICGAGAGLFILLIGLIQNLYGDEWSDVKHLNVTQWSGWIGGAPNGTDPTLDHLIGYMEYNKNLTNGFNVSMYTSMQDLFIGYGMAQFSTMSLSTNYVGLYANSPLNWTMFAEERPQGDLSKLVMAIANFLYDPQLALRNAAMRIKKELTANDIYFLMNLRAVFASTGVGLLLDSFIPAVLITGGRLVDEKKNKIRESIKVMGVADSAYILSSFISSFLRMGIGTSMISLILAAFGAIDASAIPIVFGVSALFAISLIAFAQIMPSLFSQSLWSNVVVIIFLWGSSTISALSTGFAYPLQIIVCFLSPVAFYYTVLPEVSKGSVILSIDQTTALGMLVADIFIYFIIGNYIYAVNPGEFGVPKHPLFFLGFRRKNDARRANVDSPRGKSPSINSASEMDERTPNRVVLKDLLKDYGGHSDAPAVDGLSLGIRQKEIFALLGHNGAGKTTTISILTGMVTATDYTRATVDDLDITREMDQIRKSVGLCPQFDVLFNDLTARQHLELFARIKGQPGKSERIEHLLEELELMDENKVASQFSGGMKRRLSVGNALVGGASLVFLDEPSSGMDPLSRRRMWNLLKDERDSGKTIVLTTHFMEEADYLGDRIAIMSHGKLYCCDTSQRLKEQHGVGFYLTLV